MLFSLNKVLSLMSTSFVFGGQKSAKLQSPVISHHTAEEESENKKSKSQHLERKLKLLLYVWIEIILAMFETHSAFCCATLRGWHASVFVLSPTQLLRFVVQQVHNFFWICSKGGDLEN